MNLYIILTTNSFVFWIEIGIKKLYFLDFAEIVAPNLVVVNSLDCLMWYLWWNSLDVFFIYTLSSHLFKKNLKHNLEPLFNVEVLFNVYSVLNAKLECPFEVLIFIMWNTFLVTGWTFWQVSPWFNFRGMLFSCCFSGKWLAWSSWCML